MSEIIIALDLPGDEARRLLDRIPEARWVKVGSDPLRQRRARTGEGTAPAAAFRFSSISNGTTSLTRWPERSSRPGSSGIAMATVHTLGGRAMMEAAAKAAGGELGVVGVTVLTSHTPESYGRAVGRENVAVMNEVGRLAAEALGSGLRGIVCSPLEVDTVRGAAGPNAWIVVPGIRRPGDAPGDQARTAGPAEATRPARRILLWDAQFCRPPIPRAAFLELLAAARPKS